MRLLLDTHAALWWLEDNGALGAGARKLVESGTHEILVSAVVQIEISVKQAIGKLRTVTETVPVLIEDGARELPITIEHAAVLRDLPLHHRDPFDRILIAQALVEDAVILSADTRFDAYGVKRRW